MLAYDHKNKTEYFKEVYGNPSSLHSVGQRAKEELEKARERIAARIGADANEIYFTSGGSEADNQGINFFVIIRHRSRFVNNN